MDLKVMICNNQKISIFHKLLGSAPYGGLFLACVEGIHPPERALWALRKGPLDFGLTYDYVYMVVSLGS